MQRRELIAGLGGAAVAWPLVARAQQAPLPTVGIMSFSTSDIRPAVRRGLSETGQIEGRNVAVEIRSTNGQFERMPDLAVDMVRQKVAVIVAPTTSAALAAKAATENIPIVFLVAGDPVEIGLVASLNRPGGNLTGLSSLSAPLAAKRIELLRELMPAASSFAYLLNPTNPIAAEIEAKEVQTAARTTGVRVVMLRASRESEIDAAFVTLARERASGLVVSADPLFNNPPYPVVALATRYRIPAIYDRSTDTAAGGLISYGTDFDDVWRQLGIYAGRILKGEKPADLPVQQVTTVRLSINMKTAKTLGITFPTALLVRADEVIE